MRPQLKLYTGEDESTDAHESLVSMRLGEIAQIIGDASQFKRTWLSDFEDDQVQVSADLYELLSSHCQLKPDS